MPILDPIWSMKTEAEFVAMPWFRGLEYLALS